MEHKHRGWDAGGSTAKLKAEVNRALSLGGEMSGIAHLFLVSERWRPEGMGAEEGRAVRDLPQFAEHCLS